MELLSPKSESLWIQELEQSNSISTFHQIELLNAHAPRKNNFF